MFDRNEPIADADTPEKMRVELYKQSHTNNLVRQVSVESELRGLSGEDKFTLLAYHLLRENIALSNVILRDIHTSNKPMFVKESEDG